jgi:hypothetical protein
MRTSLAWRRPTLAGSSPRPGGELLSVFLFTIKGDKIIEMDGERAFVYCAVLADLLSSAIRVPPPMRPESAGRRRP